MNGRVRLFHIYFYLCA